MSRRPRVTHVALVLGSVLHAATALAQSGTATLSGRITDQTGQIIAAVNVRATNIDTGIDTPTQSNADGIYVVGNLRPGQYRLTVTKDGFRTIVLEDLTLAVQDVLGRNFTMEVSPIDDTVTVTSSYQELNLSPAVSTIVNRQFVENMPLNGRSFQSLILLTPGSVVMAAGQGTEGQFSINGQRTNTNYFTVDGVTMNFSSNISVNLGHNVGGALPAYSISGGTNSVVSVDAMEEFRTQTSGYTAEFGRAPGAQISIATRSGTNLFHGTLYDFVRHEAFDARNWFNRPPEPEPPSRQQNFGGTLGGPLRKNQSFFFFSYEGLRLQQPQNATGFFLTPEARAAVAPVYQPFVNAQPVPNGPLQDPSCDNILTACRARLTASYSNPSSFDSYSVRLDHALTQRLAIFGRASHTPSSARTGSFNAIQIASRNTDVVTTGLNAMMSSSVRSDLRVGWSRSTGNIQIDLDDAFGATPPSTASLFRPGTSPDTTLQSVVGTGMGSRVSNAARQLNIINTLSVVAGAHQVKLGVDYRYFEPSNRGATGNIVQTSNFSQLRTGTMALVASVASEQIAVRTHNWSLFAQDNWHLNDRLTLTYGVRWEINTPPVSITPGKPLYAIEGIFDAKPLRLAPTQLWRTRYDNLAPRLGAAYQIDASTTARGGAGLFHDLGYGRLLGALIAGFPYNRVRQTNTAGQPFDLANPVFDPLPIPASLSTFTQGNLVAFDPDLQLPVTAQWNGAIERTLGRHHSLSVTYVGASGRRLLRPDFVVPPELRAQNAPAISVTRNAGGSRYDALQVQFQRRLDRGLQALASYTLAKSSDTESDDGGGNFFGAAWNANYATAVDQIFVPSLASADFDVRHSFAAAVSYELPAPPLGAVARAVFGKWAADVIVRSSSPLPLNVRIEGVSPELGVYRTQANLVPGQPIWLAAPDEPGGKVLNPDAFTLPPAGQPGNLPRNSIRSPFWINQTDLAIRRRFALTSGTSLEFRAEAFNLFNHPMFGGFSSPSTIWGRCTSTPCTGQQNPGFGKVAPGYTLNLGLGGDPLSGGQSAIYAVGGSRSMQFSLKLRF